MNQDTYGDFLRHQESPGMISDTTRLHMTWFQEVGFHKNFKILTKSSRGSVVSAPIQNLVWTQLESTSKIITMNVENSWFGYDLNSEIWISDDPGPVTGGPPDFWHLPPGGESFAPY